MSDNISPSKPQPIFPDISQIPSDLRDLPVWCAYEFVWNPSKSKWGKHPCSAVTGEERNWPESGVPVAEALAGAKKLGKSGISIIFNGSDIFGVDWDDCVDADGKIHPLVMAWAKWFPTYQELSPSRTGAHFICRGAISKALTGTPLPNAPGVLVEAYSKGRHFCFTGWRIGTEEKVQDCSIGINKLLVHLGAGSVSKNSNPNSSTERPCSIFAARKTHADYLAALRAAHEGEGNELLNKVAFFAGRCFAAKVFETETEESLKATLVDIVTKEWKKPHEERAARSTINSGWNSGITKPLQLIDWKKQFHTGSELETGEVKLYINGILPEGVTAIGSLSAVGKTWFALAMARALTSGTKFLGVFDVSEAVPVIYLVPEMGSRALRKRLERLRIPMNDCFYCQTVSDGVCPLNDPSLEAAVTELRPVVFLDTAVRFNPSNDENSASQNAALLAADLFRLVRWGARAVVCLHHSPKYSGDAEFMTLENVLRGTGDLGAMCDAVWGLQHDKRKTDNGKDWDYEYLEESQQLTRFYVRCVKPRDFDAAAAFRVQGRPHIDEKGDFVVLADGNTPELRDQVLSAIELNPKVSSRQLGDRFHIGYRRLIKMARDSGWELGKKGWSKRAASFGPGDQESIPF